MKPAGPLPGHPTPVQYMRGIGPKRAEALATVGVFSVPDLLFYVPRRYLDRSSILTIAELRRRARLEPRSACRIGRRGNDQRSG